MLSAVEIKAIASAMVDELQRRGLTVTAAVEPAPVVEAPALPGSFRARCDEARQRRADLDAKRARREASKAARN